MIICATWRRGGRTGSTWDQGQDPAWTECSWGWAGREQFRHVLVPPAYAQQHAMRHQHVPPELCDRAETEAAGDAFAVNEREADEAVLYSDEPFMEELRRVDLFECVRAAPPDPTGEAVAMRGDNLPWECGEHPALGQRHNDMSQTLHTHCERQRRVDSPLHEPPVESAVLISRQRHKSTPDMVYDVFNYVTFHMSQ